MPRKSRQLLPSFPCLVLQRGHNNSNCFFDEKDFQFYLDSLCKAKNKYQVRVHAYVLMQDHIHLLLTPTDSTGISRLMQSLGRCYVQYFNERYRRSGTLWEGRYRAACVQPDKKYLLASYRYVEMNPVRPNLVSHPGKYHWSSYHHNACGIMDRLITEHPVYSDMTYTPESTRSEYERFCSSSMDRIIIQQIRRSLNSSRPYGDEDFAKYLELLCSASKSMGRYIQTNSYFELTDINYNFPQMTLTQ